MLQICCCIVMCVSISRSDIGDLCDTSVCVACKCFMTFVGSVIYCWYTVMVVGM